MNNIERILHEHDITDTDIHNYILLHSDVDCSRCGKGVALANADREGHEYLCPQCGSENMPDLRKPVFKIFPEKAKLVEDRKCLSCGRMVTIFRDELSEKEYSISGMCQTCQDKIFGK